MNRAPRPHATLRLVLFVAILLGAVVALRSGLVGVTLSTATFEAWLDAAGWSAPLAYIVGCAILTNLMVPTSLQVIAAGLVFGWPAGFLYTIAAGIAAHLLGYAVSAWLAREAVVDLLERFGWSGILTRIEAASALQVAFLARFAPVPIGAQNYVLGLTRMPLLPYLIGSLAGCLPWFFVFAQLGASAGTGLSPRLAIGAVLFIVLAVLADRWWKHRNNRGSTGRG